MSTVAVIKPETTGQAIAVTSPTPADLLQLAMAQDGGNLDRLERLMAMQERWEANQAKRAFIEALTRFKADPPQVYKDKLVSFATRDGDQTNYKHATLADIVDAVAAGLAQNGLTHRWDVKQDGGTITVTCILTHDHGHSESVSMTSLPDQSGKKNAIQSVASTVTYLQRYTLQSITGIAAQDREEDDDGQAAGAPVTITDEQSITLADMLAATAADRTKFLAYFQIATVGDLPAGRFDEAMASLKRKERQRG